MVVGNDLLHRRSSGCKEMPIFGEMLPPVLAIFGHASCTNAVVRIGFQIE